MTSSANAAIVDRLLAREQADFAERHPRSKAIFEAGQAHFLYGTPSHWMRRWAGGFPIAVARAEGARLSCVDGLGYVDFCLGDTGGMCGHAPAAVTEAVARQLAQGATFMLPTEESLEVGAALARRFGQPYWGITTSASDANRAAIRIARMVTGRPKVLVFAGCYHGSVEEAHVTLEGNRVVLRNGIDPNAVDHARVAKVVQFNDVAAVERALSERDVSCVLTEPAMTNYGMILPLEGFHDALRELTRLAGTLLILDETHTLSSGPGGYAAAHGLDSDFTVLGKALGGGIPVGAFGVSRPVAERLWERVPKVDPSRQRQSSHLGFGGTLAGSALQVAAIRAVLDSVLTAPAFAHMIALAERLGAEARAIVAEHGLPWHVAQLGARVETMFAPDPPLDAASVAAGRDGLLEALLHVYFMNRGVLITPFHNMLLTCPASTDDDIARHSAVYGELARMLVREGVYA